MNYGTGIDPLTGLPYASGGYVNPNIGGGYGAVGGYGGVGGYGTTVVTTETTESLDPYTG